jgi:hypothetical protein
LITNIWYDILIFDNKEYLANVIVSVYELQ